MSANADLITVAEQGKTIQQYNNTTLYNKEGKQWKTSSSYIGQGTNVAHNVTGRLLN